MKRITILCLVVILIAAFPMSALANSKSNDGITLNYPNNLTECKTNFHFYTYGVGSSWPVSYDIFQLVSGSLVRVGGGSTAGNLDTWYVANQMPNNTTSTYAIFVMVYGPNAQPTKLSGQWNVSCFKTPPSQ